MDIVKIFNKYRIYTKYAVITIIILVCGLLYYGSKHKNVAGSDDIYSLTTIRRQTLHPHRKSCIPKIPHRLLQVLVRILRIKGSFMCIYMVK